MIDIEQQQQQIKQIEKELKELHEVPEENREPTFDMIANNLWTRYTELTDAERTADLREQCNNILLTANEIERITVEEETKERIRQIETELTDMYAQPTLNRKLDFDFVVDNLFDELCRLQGINETPAVRQPYEALTIVADNEAMREIDQKQADIRDTKAGLRNLYLKLKKERKDTFLISTGYFFGKLVKLTTSEEAMQFRTSCENEHEEKEKLLINRLGVEFIELSSKPTKDRQSDHDDRKEEIVRELMNMVSKQKLDEMIDAGIEEDRRVKQREALQHREKQRELQRPKSGNSSRDAKEMKESKQQDSLGLPIPQAQRDNGQKKKKRQSIEMVVTFEKENGSRHTGQSSETSVSRSVTPVEQIGSIEIEKSKSKSKSPEQQVDIGADSEPPMILDIEREEKKRSKSEPAVMTENIERKEEKEEKKTVSQPIVIESLNDDGSNGSESTRETDTSSDINIDPVYANNKGWLVELKLC